MADTATYLLSTGDYKVQGPNGAEELTRLMDDASNGSRMLGIVRALGQATLPSAPQPEWLVHDKQGNLTLMWVLKKKYYTWAKKFGPDKAAEMFLDRFGLDNFLITQPKSKSLIPAGPTKTNAYDWTREHPDLVKQYGKTFALFAPRGGDASIEALSDAYNRGDRTGITPEKMVELANSRLASIVYDRVKVSYGDKIDATETQELRELRATLIHEFPGYGQPTQYADRAVIIDELQRAANDPQLRRTEAGKGLRTYLHYRDQALAAAGGPLTGKDDAQIRQWLTDWGTYLTERYPEFQTMWDSVFASEARV
jgi:hypothetical protein